MEIPLYHGSVAEISQFIPVKGMHAGHAEYNGTLATDLKNMAMVYALKLKEGFSVSSVESALGAVKDIRGVDPKDYMRTCHMLNGTPCAIIQNRSKFLSELEHAGGGGYLYTLPSSTFSPVKTPNGAATTEWLSESSSIIPSKKERVTLEQAMHEGGQILFLKDGADFDAIMKKHQREFDAGEKQIALLQRLVDEGTLISENARRGIPNPLKFGEKSDPETFTAHWSAMPRNQAGRVSNRCIE